MTAKVHRIIAFAGSLITLIGLTMMATDAALLGVASNTWNVIAAWMMFAAAIVTGAATLLRQQADPA